MGDAGVPYREHTETVCAIRFLYDLHDMLDVFHCVFVVAGHDERHNRSLAVGGHEVLVLGTRQVVVRHRGYDVVSQRSYLVVDRFDFRSELRVIHGQGLRLDDDYFGQRSGATAFFFQQTFCAGGLCASAELELGGGGRLEDVG